MIQKIKNYVMVIATTLALAVPAFVPTLAASAACNNIGNGIATGASGVTGGTVNCSTTGVGDGDIANLAKNLVNTFSVIVGVVAVIMIIVGGFRYITSGGDSGRVGNAKNSLIYAIVGLIIVALAQLIVHFVLGQTSTISQ